MNIKLSVLKYLILFILLSFSINTFAQEIINGDFENHTYDECAYNLSDEIFNENVVSVFAFGKAFIAGNNVGELDIQTFDCYVDPTSGSWCAGLSSDTSSFSDALSMELTSSLEIGGNYEITFSIYSSSTAVNPIEIGLSNDKDEFGVSLGFFTPVFDQWTSNKISFTAEESSKHVTVRATPGAFSWTQVDAFSLNPKTNSINKNTLEQVKVFPNPTYDHLSIELGDSKKSVQASIYDILGKKFFTTSYSNVDKIDIDLSSLPPATYILVLEDAQVNQTLRIIKL